MPRRQKSNRADELLPAQYRSAIAPFLDDEFIAQLAEALAVATEATLSGDEVQAIHVNLQRGKRARSPRRHRGTPPPF
jgi:hypothetical protein